MYGLVTVIQQLPTNPFFIEDFYAQLDKAERLAELAFLSLAPTLPTELKQKLFHYCKKAEFQQQDTFFAWVVETWPSGSAELKAKASARRKEAILQVIPEQLKKTLAVLSPYLEEVGRSEDC